jgi:uncharacterized protein YigE (DUF2233 family)
MTQQNFSVKITLVLLIAVCLSCGEKSGSGNESFATFAVDPNKTSIEFFLRDEANYFKSIENLKRYVERNGRRLRFAMNSGMYQEDNKPLGLFIENQKTITPLNKREAGGNFYIKPNGVFYITTDKRAFISKTEDFTNDGQIKFATQSGPMLLVGGEINAEFTPNSDNIHIRNGVCVTEDNQVIFAISKRRVNFYDFARHFKDLNCVNALYLDGGVSRMYLPEQRIEQLDGDFGVIVAVTE